MDKFCVEFKGGAICFQHHFEAGYHQITVRMTFHTHPFLECPNPPPDPAQILPAKFPRSAKRKKKEKKEKKVNPFGGVYTTKDLPFHLDEKVNNEPFWAIKRPDA